MVVASQKKKELLQKTSNNFPAVHRWFANKSCPGYSVFDGKGAKVYPQNASAPAASNGAPFMVKISINDLNIRKGAGTDYARTHYIPAGVYTIVEVKSGKGSTAGWGLLKSGAGWISLDYAKKI